MQVPEDLRLILESISRNGRVNRSVLATLDMSQLLHDDGVGGWNVGQHLADMVDFRHSWLSRVSPHHSEQIPIVVPGRFGSSSRQRSGRSGESKEGCVPRRSFLPSRACSLR
jgi:uncharacterized damage-inducible protein DinB